MVGLEELPDELLIKILEYNGHDHILRLADTSTRLNSLLSYNLLWRNVDFRLPVSLPYLRKCLKYLGPHTKSFRIHGYLNKIARRSVRKSNLSASFLRDLQKRCTDLKHICLSCVFLEKDNFFFSHLPESLERLELRGTEAPVPHKGARWVLHNITSTKNLKEVHITGCSWVSAMDVVTCLSIKTLNLLSIEESKFATGVDLGKHLADLRVNKRCVGVPVKVILSDCGITNVILTSFSFSLARACSVDLSKNSVDRRGLGIVAEIMNGVIVGNKVMKAELARSERRTEKKAKKDA